MLARPRPLLLIDTFTANDGSNGLFGAQWGLPPAQYWAGPVGPARLGFMLARPRPLLLIDMIKAKHGSNRLFRVGGKPSIGDESLKNYLGKAVYPF